MFLTGVIQAFIVLLQTVFFNIFVRFTTLHYDLNGILFTCICGIAASFMLLAYSGPGKLGLGSMKNWATWAYGFCGLAQASLDIYLVQYVSATELSLFSRISIPIAVILAFMLFRRTPNKQDLIAVLSIILGSLILFYVQDSQNLQTVVIIVMLIAIFRAGEFLSTEVHSQSVTANESGNMKDRARVVGFASFTSSAMFLIFCLIVANFKNDIASVIPVIKSFPDLNEFSHLPTIIFAILYGTIITAFVRFCIWSATYKIKTENLLAILVLVPISTFIIENILSQTLDLQVNTIMFAGDRGIFVFVALILMTAGSLLSIIPKVMSNIIKHEGQTWLQALKESIKRQANNYEVQHDVFGSSDYTILQQSLGFFDRDFAKVAQIYNVTEDSVKVILASRGNSSFMDETSRKIHKIYQSEIVVKDKLTKAKNRIALSMDISELISQNADFSLILLDLNDFKPVNDTYGHEAGDIVLIETVKRLEKLYPEAVYRLGGDEFVLICKKQITNGRLNTIKQAVNQEVSYKTKLLKIGTSLGVAEFKKDGLTQDQLLDYADKNLYLDKGNKR